MARFPTIGGKNIQDPGALMESADRNATPLGFWQRSNSYTCPRGPEAGVAWLLMLRSDLDELDKNAFHELKWVDGNRTLTIPSLSIVRTVWQRGRGAGCAG